jgi:Zn ribbon nucleic-acid-binding protein
MMLYMEHGVEKVTCVDCGDTQVCTYAIINCDTMYIVFCGILAI